MPVPSGKATVSGKNNNFVIIPEGLYTVQVVDIEFKAKEDQKSGKFEPKDKYYIKLGILNLEQRGQRITHFVSTSFTSGFEGGQASKLYEFACAVYGEQLDQNIDFDVNTLIGGRVRVLIKHVIKDGRTNQNIATVMKCTKEDMKLEELVGDAETDKIDLDDALEGVTI